LLVKSVIVLFTDLPVVASTKDVKSLFSLFNKPPIFFTSLIRYPILGSALVDPNKVSGICCALPGINLPCVCCATKKGVSKTAISPSFMACFICFSVAGLPNFSSSFLTSSIDLFFAPWNIKRKFSVGSFAPIVLLKARPTPSPMACPPKPNKNSWPNNFANSSFSCNWKPSNASTTSSPSLPPPVPKPLVNNLPANFLLPSKEVTPLSILNCGLKAAIAPAIGPTTPIKSDKSPVDKLNLFSSIIVFFLISVPSCNFIDWYGKLSSCNPLGVKASCPVVLRVNPSEPTIFCNSCSCSSAVSALASFLRKDFTGTPVS